MSDQSAIVEYKGSDGSPSVVTSSNGLPVNIVAGSSSGTQYTDAQAAPTHPIGDAIEFNNAGTWTTVSNSNGLPVNVVAGGAGTSSSYGAAFPATGTAIGATDGTNMQSLKVDGSKNLLTSVNTALPAGSNNIGGVEIIDSGGTNKLAVDASGRVSVLGITNAIPAGSNNIGGVEIIDSGGTNKLAVDASGRVSVLGITNAIPAGGNTIGAVTQASGPWTSNVTQFGGNNVATGTGAGGVGIPRVTVSNDSVVGLAAGSNTIGTVKQTIATSGGSIPYHNLTAATTNFTNVKAAATQCYSVRASNPSGTAMYVKLYDKATTPATTDVPKTTVYVPGTSVVVLAFPEGMQFSNGFGWAATGGVADNDNTATSANNIVDYSLGS